jgi:hypothetical protein
MDNPAEDVIIQKWAEQEAKEKELQQATAGASKKRKLITQSAASGSDFEVEVLSTTTASSSTTGRKGRPKKAVGAAKFARKME